MSKKTLALIIGLVLILGALVVLIFFHKKAVSPTNPMVISSASPSAITTPRPPIYHTVPFTKAGVDKIQEKLNHPVSLSTSDSQIRQQLLNITQGNSGTIYSTTQFNLKYYRPFDLFESELLIPDLNSAKQATVNWLKSQGLSDQGVCNLPLSFTLSGQVEDQLAGKGIDFNPSPDGC